MPAPNPVTVAFGDGIGPEIMAACLRILDAAGARLAPEFIEIGEKVYRRGVTSGIAPESWDSLRRTKVFYKAPITTPQGAGMKSLNVTVRKSLGLFANVRPARAYAPFVATAHPTMDVVVIRENEEDLYAGIEHRQTDEVYQCLKLMSRPGCERIARYAFDYARAHGRKRVTCFTKDNIMKLTDGLFHQVFDETAALYPEIQADHMIIDIGAAKLARAPGSFDVILAPNLYGDIVSDIAAELAGSIGLAGSANIGVDGAMFEAVHGTAPQIAGRGIANPSGLLMAGVMMLSHLGQGDVAETVHNAWLATLEEGLHTIDLYCERDSRQKLGTAAFADAVIARLGSKPSKLATVRFAQDAPRVMVAAVQRKTPARKAIVGIDVFVHWSDGPATKLADILAGANGNDLRLSMITNRGVKIWPEGLSETFCTDHWRCRFTTNGISATDHAGILALLGRIADTGIDFVKTETLCTFDGAPGYSLGQGQ